MSHSHHQAGNIKQRLATEMKRYALVSSYLFVCFVVILVYEASLLGESQPSLVAHGMALGKALVIGKFILIGEALGAGDRLSAPTLFFRVAYRSVIMLLVLLVLKVIEELIIGWVHGRGTGAIFGEMFDKPWISLLAPVLMMLLILIPLIAATELNRALRGQLGSLVFGQDDDADAAGNRTD